jgi:hypothetical protein
LSKTRLYLDFFGVLTSLAEDDIVQNIYQVPGRRSNQSRPRLVSV